MWSFITDGLQTLMSALGLLDSGNQKSMDSSWLWEKHKLPWGCIGWMSLSCERSASGDKHTRRWQKHQKRVSFESRTAAGSNCSPFRRQADLFRLISSFSELLLEFREKQRFKAAGDVWLSLCFIAVSAQCLQTHRRTYSKHSEGYTNMHTLTTQFYLYTQWKTQHTSIHYSSGTVGR